MNRTMIRTTRDGTGSVWHSIGGRHTRQCYESTHPCGLRVLFPAWLLRRSLLCTWLSASAFLVYMHIQCMCLLESKSLTHMSTCFWALQPSRLNCQHQPVPLLPQEREVVMHWGKLAKQLRWSRCLCVCLAAFKTRSRNTALTWAQQAAASSGRRSSAASRACPCKALHVRLKGQVQAGCLCCRRLLSHRIIVHSTCGYTACCRTLAWQACRTVTPHTPQRGVFREGGKGNCKRSRDVHKEAAAKGRDSGVKRVRDFNVYKHTHKTLHSIY